MQPREALKERKASCPIGTHHKPLGVLLHMFVRGNGDGHRLLVAVVEVGLDIISCFQSIRLLSWNRQHSQHQLLLPRTDEVHHLLMGGTFHAHPIAGGRVRAGEQVEGETFQCTRQMIQQHSAPTRAGLDWKIVGCVKCK